MLIDSHAHLDMPEFAEDRVEVVERALQGGVSRILTVGIDLASSRAKLTVCLAILFFRHPLLISFFDYLCPCFRAYGLMV